MSVLQPLTRCQSKTSFDDNRNMSRSGAGDGAQRMHKRARDKVNPIMSSRRDEAQRKHEHE